MEAIRVLKKEHDLILQVIDLLGLSREYLEKGVIIPCAFYEKAVIFCRDFADQFHHFKEEFLLFGLLAYKKEGKLDAVMGTLRYQHEQCSQCVARIEKAIEENRPYDEMTVTLILESVSVYVSLMRRHIYLENTIFFPMAEKALSGEEKQSLADQFAYEENRMDSKGSMWDEKRAIVDELSKMLAGEEEYG